MKTLYIRIVAIFILITLISSILALFIANAYYNNRMKTYTQDKVLPVAEQVRHLYEGSSDQDIGTFMQRIGSMGYQIYLVDKSGNGQVYGSPFKHSQFDPSIAEDVLAGTPYLGKHEERRFLEIMGYFENSIRNTVGLPLKSGEEIYAMFLRPDLQNQLGEIRILLAILLGHAFILILALIIILTRTIVEPLKALKAATRKIVGGNYKIGLDVKRRDEIGDLARDFSHMAQSLEKLDDMRTEFVANVSHEFQTPVTSIQGFTQAILDNKTTEEEERQYLTIIHEESRRLSSLSKQLLTLAALDKETTLTRREPFRLDEQIRQVLIVTEWQWSKKGLELVPELPEVMITADEGLLYHVWMNLIANSIKFTGTGDRISIAISIDRHIVVTISDTGVGISADKLPYIFDRFYKVDQARGRTQTGSGLGLSICRKIVELHGGTIEAASEPGEGTRFIVTLPYL
ncbi:sensor histidine kinase [Paenibacillus sp. 1011MAR3C5]|uniref:sensor histidine kinase n=1 Tax=Paenibacillus sp. 1011MAR3C5 TaxID=1675787 RepID=UPI000E6BF622|nr:HAMP domain-containing sensor histidine kinase [Paenibacillus sp. 1011MAR3C5]RJE88517.1 sensor histidine kinase [Paenibacillus sp. 1011MAR3C5]